jgi:hypothetical protein
MDAGADTQLAARISRVMDRASTILVTWAASLAVILLTAIVPLANKIDRFDVVDARARRSGDRARQTSAALGLQIARLERSIKPGRVTVRENVSQVQDQITRLQATRSGLIDRSGRTAADRAKLRQELTNVGTPLGPLSVPTMVLPLVWLALAGGIVVFWASRRASILAMAAELSAMRERPAGTEAATECVSPDPTLDVPFWVSPLPKMQWTIYTQRRVSGENLSALFGWGNGGRRQMQLLAVWAVGVTVVCIWVTIIAYRLSAQHPDPQVTARVLLASLMAMVLVAVTIVSVVLAALGSRTPAYEQILARRRVVGWLGTSLASGLALYLLAPRKLLPRAIRFDARRRRPPIRPSVDASFPSSAFLLNTSTGIVHFVGGGGFHSQSASFSRKRQGANDVSTSIMTVEAGAVAKLIQSDATTIAALRELIAQRRSLLRRGVSGDSDAMSSATIPGPRLLKCQVGAVAECLAAQMVDGGRSKEAVVLLTAGLSQDDAYRRNARLEPNLRLYDFLGRLLADDSKGMAVFSHRASATWPKHRYISKRVGRWNAGVKARRATSKWKIGYGVARAFSGLPTLKV